MIPFSEIYITNRHLCQGDLVERIALLTAHSPKYIILREKDLPESEYRMLAERAIAACASSGVTCVLHTFVNVARRLNHPAIHLPMTVLRTLSEEDHRWFQVLGASCHSVEEALEAQRLGCTYITAGHIFPTECKADVPARGLQFLREICQAVSIPVYGLGGITDDNRMACLTAGATGTAVMSSAMLTIG